MRRCFNIKTAKDFEEFKLKRYNFKSLTENYTENDNDSDNESTDEFKSKIINKYTKLLV